MSTTPEARGPRGSTRAGRWLVLACLLGCNASSAPADHEATRSQSAPPVAPPTASASTAEPPRASAAPPASASSAAAAGDLSGSWTGSYDARKGVVGLPPKVKDKALAADDGKAAAGPGTIEISVTPGGDVRGKTSGALGGGAIVGRVDGATIRAVVRPEDPQQANAMTGILIGERKGEVIACDLRVAGPDATVIRESAVELKRKP